MNILGISSGFHDAGASIEQRTGIVNEALLLNLVKYLYDYTTIPVFKYT